MLRKNILKQNRVKAALVGLFLLFIAAFFIIPANLALAQTPDLGQSYGDKLGLGSSDPRIMIANIVRVILGFLAIIVVGLILYAGFLWMTSAGNEQKIETAKRTLKNAVIGLIIILASFGITTFLIGAIQGSLTGGGGGGGSSNSGGSGISALGSGIIETHYPERGQRNVPRNTRISITFKEPMKVDTIIADTNGNSIFGDWVDANGNSIMDAGEYDTINTSNILLYKSVDGLSGPKVTKLFAAKTLDNKTFVFIQADTKDYIGSPSEKIWYTVALGTSIVKASGDAAFPGAIGSIGYNWQFEVSTIIDVTPPKVKNVFPVAGTTEPRNVVIQVNFDEAVDPISASGPTSAFNNLEVDNSGTLVDGTFFISNQYQTVEFLTNDKCGVNSCGDDIYCLPGNAALTTTVKAATLIIASEPTGAFPYDGVVDMCGNSLDGNADDAASGPPADNYLWSFNTSNVINNTPPLITAISPNYGASGIPLDNIPEAEFNKILMSASINTSSCKLVPASGSINFWTSKNDNTTIGHTTVRLKHDQYNESVSYRPHLNSLVKDVYQNCYNPGSGPGCTGGPSCCDGTPSTANQCP